MKYYNQIKSFLFFIGILSILSFTSFQLSAQPNGKPNGSITGKVIDLESKKAIQRATVSIHSTETQKVITGGYTDKTGKFVINVPNGNYYVEVKFVGYDTAFVRNIAITASKQEHNCGDLTLKLSAIMQKEIQVTAKREAIEVGLDRKVFNIEQDASNIGGSALDVLANIPSVTVDQDDNVSLRGNSNVKIMIDGRVSNLTASEALEQIPSTMISAVELITNPGARYEADGTAGMINIVTTRQREDGLNGMVNIAGGVNQGLEPSFTGSVNVNMNVGKWNFFANIGSRIGNNSGTSERNRTLFNGEDTLQTLMQEGDNSRGRRGYRGKIGMDYNFSKADILTYAFTLGKNKFASNNKNTYWVYDKDNKLTEYYNREEDNESPLGTTMDHTLSYKHNFEDKGHELYIDLLYNNFDRDGLTYYNQNNFTAPDFTKSVLSKQQNVSGMKMDGYTAQIDYAVPIGTNFKLEAGGKYSNRNVNIDNHLDDWIENNWISQPFSIDRFEYTEQIAAAYITASTKLFDIVKFNAGVRSETTIIDFNSILNTDYSFKDDYTLYFPSVYLAYDLNVNHQVSANFASRMRRPNYWDLNPITNYEDPLNLRKGNPGLRPESNYMFELGYLMNYDKYTLTTTIFHRYSTDGIEMYKEVINGDTTLVMPKNISTSSRTGFEFIFMYKIFDNWKADANYSLYSYNIDASNIGANKQTAFNWTARFNSQISLLNRFLDFTFTANIRSKTLRAQGESKGNWNLDAAFRFNLSRQLSLSMRLQDIFNTRQWDMWESIPGVLYSEMHNKMNSRAITIGLTYKIKADYKQKRERNVDDGRMDESE